MSEKGRLVVVSGFSGAGKGTLMKALMEQYGNDYALSVSATTRNPQNKESERLDSAHQESGSECNLFFPGV